MLCIKFLFEIKIEEYIFEDKKFFENFNRSYRYLYVLIGCNIYVCIFYVDINLCIIIVLNKVFLNVFSFDNYKLQVILIEIDCCEVMKRWVDYLCGIQVN